MGMKKSEHVYIISVSAILLGGHMCLRSFLFGAL
jgi:hypothetical protein